MCVDFCVVSAVVDLLHVYPSVPLVRELQKDLNVPVSLRELVCCFPDMKPPHIRRTGSWKGTGQGDARDRYFHQRVEYASVAGPLGEP
mmetsp:Transcript_10282/g.31439  ORF Transcript_10282/g.31439 Transcript_10282/m.31439 type:complete len:88 (+) Transcript_10282:44-307(+)